MVTIKVNGFETSVPEGSTVMQAAAAAGFMIPSLCSHPDLQVKDNCKVCVVDVNGEIKTACSEVVAPGMEVKTNTPRVIAEKRNNLKKILKVHPQDCLNCARNQNCELQTLAGTLIIRSFEHKPLKLPQDRSTPSIVRDPSKCTLCLRCVEMCNDVQTVGALEIKNGVPQTIDGKALIETKCVMCGQCALVCPVGAIIENEEVEEFLAAVADPEKIVITQIAPAVRVAVAEELGITTGALDMLNFVAGLRQLGFDYVFHTNFTADLTILEEGNELLKRLKEGGTLPMLTSCSPGWINFIETFYPDQLDHLSTCKSPQQMFGALAKTYWAEKMGIDPAKIYSVSIMPCTAKKFEAQRPEMNASGFRDVDLVLTTREVGKLFRMGGAYWDKLEPSNFDSLLGAYTGAGVIFGASGGVMEAALRTVYEVVTGQTLEDVNFTGVRGFESMKKAEVDLSGTKVKVAVANSLGAARKIMDEIKAGTSPYHFIEVMCCPGGCIGGGGQPIPSTIAKKKERIEAIYVEDEGLPLRKSHDNPEVKKLYEDFLKEPLGHKSHELLHTHYHPSGK
ncbi:NADH-dependent [FeFe] hydrogenase, group A6 [Syntrophomonas wolfei]|uniref:(Fe) hydrogenase, large subunit HymC, putative n=1 Tax=Syntrophomonas wolfei subsp. wolfei (strain DSM 2245B / Goettingen) TaxID=335541 RepID=Q0AU79_SYNWW|nr:NADH-dependent [FeFe] hydrogenase, group A6 [Syntrophomonas wolfei]ABI69725.1 (Fe) hydrogenase, large subunit HymC, putative [Syntrophomonas wolfei subsp. wolfei str. Goettingen G311]